MLAAELEAVLHGLETAGVAAQTLIDALLHLSRDGVFGNVRHVDLLPLVTKKGAALAGAATDAPTVQMVYRPATRCGITGVPRVFAGSSTVADGAVRETLACRCDVPLTGIHSAHPIE
jgi:hypothetical protein